MRSLKMLALLLPLMELSASVPSLDDEMYGEEKRFSGPYVPENPKMDLTQDELDKLASLSGKEKKKYVKELKQKYGNK